MIEIKFIKRMLYRILVLACLFFFSISGLLCKEKPLKFRAEKASIYFESERGSFIIKRAKKAVLISSFQNVKIQLTPFVSKGIRSQRGQKVGLESSRKRKNCIKLRAGYFRPSEWSFKDIYGGGMTFGGEINIRLWKFFDLWFIGNYYFKKGRLPFTKEKTKMSLIPIGGGPKINFRKGMLNLYIGFGPLIFVYEETNPIGVAQGTDLGIIGQTGSSINVVGSLLLDLCLNYSYCRVKPQKIKANLGGVQVGIGIGYEF